VNLIDGTLIDCLAIILGYGIGLVLHKYINKKIMSAMFEVIALIALISGIGMALKSINILIPMISLILGYNISTFFKLSKRLNKKLKVKDVFDIQNYKRVNIFSAATIATMLSLIGPMAILGPIKNGFEGDNTILLLKSGFDFVVTIFLTVSLGKGVVFSILPVLVFQGGLTLLASISGYFISSLVITEMSATGGVIMLMMGLSILEIKKFDIINTIPGILIAGLLTYIIH